MYLAQFTGFGYLMLACGILHHISNYYMHKIEKQCILDTFLKSIWFKLKLNENTHKTNSNCHTRPILEFQLD